MIHGAFSSVSGNWASTIVNLSTDLPFVTLPFTTRGGTQGCDALLRIPVPCFGALKYDLHRNDYATLPVD